MAGQDEAKFVAPDVRCRYHAAAINSLVLMRMIVDPAFADACVTYVRDSIRRTLNIGDVFETKMEAGGVSHLGRADIDNTHLAYEQLSSFGYKTIIEEDLPPFSEWRADLPVVFVDPVDGSSEVGCGGLQFAAAVSLYDKAGVPIFTAAASPGLRPIFRQSNGSFSGFGGEVGILVFGGPTEVWMLPLWSNSSTSPIRVPTVQARSPGASAYTNVALDPNKASICGLRKSHKLTTSSISRMPYSNIFSQLQVILGQADAATLGPTTLPQEGDRSGIGVSGPKAWDLVMPIAHGVGLEYYSSEKVVSAVEPSNFLESFVISSRLYLVNPSVKDLYMREIDILLDV